MKTDLPVEIKRIIPKLDENQLILLNHQIVERLKLLNKARQLNEMSKYTVGEKVSFDHYGRIITGKIIRLNQKTVSRLTDENEKWNVAPALISKIVEVVQE